MKELFKDAFKVINNNIILTIPLILFVKILDLYSAYSRYSVDSNLKFIIASLTILFMFGVFCAGWFYMVKEAVQLSKKVFVLDSDRANETLKLFTKIPEGIGKFFLSFCGVYLIFIILQIFVTPFVYVLGANLIGALDQESMLSLQKLAIETSSTQSIAAFVDGLSMEQIVFFGKWSLLLTIMSTIFMYLFMLWVPEIIYYTPNPLKALYYSLIKLFKDFFTTVRLYLTLWFIGFILLFIYTFAVINPFAYVFMSIVLFYFTAYLVVLIYLYYDRKYANEA